MGNTATHKKCPHCGEMKDREKDFGRTKRKTPNGLPRYRAYCKSCVGEVTRIYAEKKKKQNDPFYTGF